MILIFAIELHHCRCYAPTICPSFTTSNFSLLCISKTNCTLAVHVPGIFASTCLTPALELLLLNVGAYMPGSRLKNEHRVGFTSPNQTQFWISRKVIIYFSMANLFEWKYQLGWLLQIRSGQKFITTFDICLKENSIISKQIGYHLKLFLNH